MNETTKKLWIGLLALVGIIFITFSSAGYLFTIFSPSKPQESVMYLDSGSCGQRYYGIPDIYGYVPGGTQHLNRGCPEGKTLDLPNYHLDYQIRFSGSPSDCNWDYFDLMRGGGSYVSCYDKGEYLTDIQPYTVMPDNNAVCFGKFRDVGDYYMIGCPAKNPDGSFFSTGSNGEVNPSGGYQFYRYVVIPKWADYSWFNYNLRTRTGINQMIKDKCGYASSEVIDYGIESIQLNNNLKVTILTGFYFDDTVNTVNVKIDSPFSGDVPIRLYAYLEAKSGATVGDTGSIYLDYTKNVNLVPGSNNVYSFVLPTDLKIGEYTFHVTPLYFGQTTVGVAPLPGGSTCPGENPNGYVRLTKSETTRNFLVNPKSLYLRVNNGASCPTGYTFSLEADSPTGATCDKANGCICVRSDYSDLSCVQLGCPVDVDYTYECTSTGYCAEKIYQSQACTTDLECGLNMKCETVSGVCYNEVIYNQILQCETAADCTNPCSGITVGCIANKCSWSGECTPILNPQDCNALGCEQGTCNTDSGNCEVTITANQTTQITNWYNNINPPTAPTKEEITTTTNTTTTTASTNPANLPKQTIMQQLLAKDKYLAGGVFVGLLLLLAYAVGILSSNALRVIRNHKNHILIGLGIGMIIIAADYYSYTTIFSFMKNIFGMWLGYTLIPLTTALMTIYLHNLYKRFI